MISLFSGKAFAICVATALCVPAAAQSPDDADRELGKAIRTKDKLRVRTLIRHPSIDKEGGYPSPNGTNPVANYKYWLTQAILYTDPNDGIFDVLIAGGSRIGNPPLYMASCYELPYPAAALQVLQGRDRGWIPYIANNRIPDLAALGPSPHLCLASCKPRPGNVRLNAVLAGLLGRVPTQEDEGVYNLRVMMALTGIDDLSKNEDGTTADACNSAAPLVLRAATDAVRDALTSRGLHLYNNPSDPAGWSVAHWLVAHANSFYSSEYDPGTGWLQSMRYLRDNLTPKDAKSGYSQFFVEAMLSRSKAGATPESLLDLRFQTNSTYPDYGWMGMPIGSGANRVAIRQFIRDSYAHIRASGHSVPASLVQCQSVGNNNRFRKCTVADIARGG